MNALQVISKLLVGLLALWAVYASITAFFGISVYFPLRLADAEPIPYHRWQSARVSVFLTFAYFSFIHLLNGSREIYPIKFLEVYLTILTELERLSQESLTFGPEQKVDPTRKIENVYWNCCRNCPHSADC